MRVPPAEEDRIARAHELVSRGSTLLDVRSPEEFSAGHIQDARNIPVEDLLARLHELGPKDRPVAVYCRSGRRSAFATRLLGACGFAQVDDLGGIDASGTSHRKD